MFRSITVTGGNAGLGFEAARGIAANRSTRLVVACRDLAIRKQAVEQLEAMGRNSALRALPTFESSKAI